MIITRTLAVSVFALLAACSPPAPSTTSTETATPTTEAAATAPEGAAMTAGQMSGMSTSAAGDVAAATINADGLAFANADGEDTFTAPTTYLGAVAPSTPIAAGGQSFADAAPSANATNVELRRINGAAPAGLCGGAQATHVAIVYMVPLTALQVMVFTGADAPGPSAHDSAVCAIYAYGVD